MKINDIIFPHDTDSAFLRLCMLNTYGTDQAVVEECAAGASQDAIDALGEWMTSFGNSYWNGECFDIDDGLGLWPVYGEPNEDGDVELIRYEIR